MRNQMDFSSLSYSPERDGRGPEWAGKRLPPRGFGAVCQCFLEVLYQDIQAGKDRRYSRGEKGLTVNTDKRKIQRGITFRK